MGYKKLDEIMELLSDELDGFDKALEKLDRLTRNVDGIKISPDTAPIERLLREHLHSERDKSTRILESLENMAQQLSRARLVPKLQLRLHYALWACSLLLIGYLAVQVSRVENVREMAQEKGRHEVLSDLKGYFDDHPEHFKMYLEWTTEKGGIPNR